MKVYEALERYLDGGREHHILVGVLTPNEMDKLQEVQDTEEDDTVCYETIESFIRKITGNEYGDDDFCYYATDDETKGDKVSTGWDDTEVILEDLIREYSEEQTSAYQEYLNKYPRHHDKGQEPVCFAEWLDNEWQEILESREQSNE